MTSSNQSSAVTRLLGRFRAGDTDAAEQIASLVNAELQALARAVFSGESPGHTLQPTALVNEAWMKLAGHIESITDRNHFFVLAGKAMRQIIADHARGKLRAKRGGDRRRVTLQTNLGEPEANGAVDLVDLDDCLRALAERSERHAEVAELRLFSGMSIRETASVLGRSRRSVESDWAMAKAWLRKELAAR